MKRREFYETINNIILDIFPEFRKFNIEIKFINKNNKSIRNDKILGNCEYIWEKRKYIIRVLKNPKPDKYNAQFCNSLNISEIEGQIIKVLLHEYAHIWYKEFIMKGEDLNLYHYNINNRLLHRTFIKIINKYLDKDDLDYLFSLISIDELFANKMAYMYFPVVANKLNKMNITKNNLNISKKEFRELAIESIYKRFIYIKDKCNIKFVTDKYKDRLVEFYGVCHYKKDIDKFNIRIVRNPMVSSEFRQYIKHTNIPLKYGLELFTILHVIGKAAFYNNIMDIDKDLYYYIKRDILKNNDIIITISNLIDNKNKQYLLRKNLMFDNIYSDSFAYRFLPIIFNDVVNEIKNNKK